MTTADGMSGRPWTIGTCAVGGLTVAKPDPGRTAWLLAVTTDLDGHVRRQVVVWEGYTAASLRKHWAKRAKEAGWEHCWDGDALAVLETEGELCRRTFHDTKPEEAA